MIIGGPSLDFIAGVPWEDVKGDIIEMFSMDNLPYVLLFMIIYATISGGFCKRIVEQTDCFIVEGMHGLITYVYIKEKMQWEYTDEHILNPAGSPGRVSNEHILLKDHNHKSIIYPIGTCKFMDLKKRQEEVRKEQESRLNS